MDTVPRLRALSPEELGVRGGAEHKAMLDRDVLQRLVELRIHEQHGRPRVLDDVPDLLGIEPEVDGHEDAAEHAHAEKSDEEARGIRGYDGHAVVLADAKVVESGGEAPRHPGELRVRDAAQPAARRVGLVDHGLAVSVHLLRALQEIRQGERDDHRCAPLFRLGLGPSGAKTPRRSADAAGVDGVHGLILPDDNRRVNSPFLPPIGVDRMAT
jgi:hypothetical protein